MWIFLHANKYLHAESHQWKGTVCIQYRWYYIESQDSEKVLCVYSIQMLLHPQLHQWKGTVCLQNTDDITSKVATVKRYCMYTVYQWLHPQLHQWKGTVFKQYTDDTSRVASLKRYCVYTVYWWHYIESCVSEKVLCINSILMTLHRKLCQWKGTVCIQYTDDITSKVWLEKRYCV